MPLLHCLLFRLFDFLVSSQAGKTTYFHDRLQKEVSNLICHLFLEQTHSAPTGDVNPLSPGRKHATCETYTSHSRGTVENELLLPWGSSERPMLSKEQTRERGPTSSHATWILLSMQSGDGLERKGIMKDIDMLGIEC
ncbi:hypothetical protein BP00DRAFT_154993 [Aspergillus indologenus CBS 114.80]|uniref:Secreted protein n=1 Tax=Aspergillus indologenus CBS 114.80 TaxID=1450541 RepID=A0A2V5I6E5_9EURO|nr:hypothetical protein BP00DRAFT_154993 [Aspergillus indologenus CBS 114.80]